MHATKDKVILLVEDTRIDEGLMLRALANANIKNKIVVARDGQQAIDYLFGTGSYAGRDIKDLPQIVLLDLKLPKVDGLEILRRIRAHPITAKLPVIVLTASDEEKDTAEGYQLGANSYVLKPVDFWKFMDVVSRLGIYWALDNQPPPS